MCKPSNKCDIKLTRQVSLQSPSQSCFTLFYILLFLTIYICYFSQGEHNHKLDSRTVPSVLRDQHSQHLAHQNAQNAPLDTFRQPAVPRSVDTAQKVITSISPGRTTASNVPLELTKAPRPATPV